MSTPLTKFRMPAEYEKHAKCWMLWPVRPDNWRLDARPAQLAFVELATAISEFEPLMVGCLPSRLQDARRMLPQHIQVVEVQYNDIWVRDTGPTCVTSASGDILGIDWEFNSWGGLFESWALDNAVARQLLEIEEIPRLPAGLTLEGGAINVDGEGTLVTTEECVLNSNRNPGLTKAQAERLFSEYLGVRKVIWIARGMYADEAGGHVDNLCVFVRPAVLALTWTDDPTDPQYERSREALEILTLTTDALGRRLDVVKIHQPEPQFITVDESRGFVRTAGTISRKSGDRLPASYINFYIANNAVFLPVVNDPMDQSAIETLRRLFPSRRIVPVATREFLLGGGGIHCFTQQIPATDIGSIYAG